MRRYRVYLLVAIFFLVTIYYSTRSGVFEFKRLGKHNRAAGFKGRPIPKRPEEYALLNHVETAETYNSNKFLSEGSAGRFDGRIESQPPRANPEVETVPNDDPSTFSTEESKSPQPAAEKPDTELLTTDEKTSTPLLPDNEAEKGSGRLDVSGLDDPATDRWRKLKMQNPLKVDEIIRLPSAPLQPIPKIQASFSKGEDASERRDRLEKLNIVKESFKHAWNGYKKYGLPHDEIKPLSKGFADPFMGWGATLVDSLDTLWIMDLKEEFEAALVEVGKIDFTTSLRPSIPLFETVIRYLGGLIAAYDISGAQYPILLRKAEELAEILMGAFDTPNRMPITFYDWRQASISKQNLASSHAVMSELGSLSVEMTRLAQITKKHEYYDAIARITNGLEKWQQNTRLPGLWPLKVDASGCKSSKQSTTETTKSDEEINQSGNLGIPGSTHHFADDYDHEEDGNYIVKRDVSDPVEYGNEDGENQATTASKKGSSKVREKQSAAGNRCTPQGLTSEKNLKTEIFAIGGQADSTYEYFPKMHALLRGRNKQYENMYFDAMTSIRENLLFRPMIKEKDREILFAARQEFTPKATNPLKRKEIIYEVTHLSCFIGGMVGLGARLFDIESDMELAKQLTDGCVWAYESMPVGVMAESASVVPCPDMKVCAWNETRWHEALDPDQKERSRAVKIWNQKQKVIFDTAKKLALTSAELVEAKSRSGELEAAEEIEDVGHERPNVKRDDSYDIPSKTGPLPVFEEAADSPVHNGPLPTTTAYVPKTAQSHEKYVKARIQEERLPEGYTKIFDRHYGLRPEAIESVFYMYRITGDKAWREKGWQMFLAIQAATQTEFANAAVKDVTSVLGVLEDTMESFWLAETLKYFYLLFSKPDVVNLDEWVLNTEAHPMRIQI